MMHMNKSFPPPDYIQTESAVDGIVVYKPKPPEEHDTVLNFHCPNCTATTAYSTDDGGLTCSSCGYHEVPEVEQVGKEAEEFEFTVEALEHAVHGWGEERKELVCNNCAAHTTLPLSSLTMMCPFCGSNKVVQMKAVQDVLRPRFIVPFATTTAQCRQITSEWLGDSWLFPDKLQNLGRSVEYVPVYVPFWTFDARALADWTAEEAHRKKGWDGKTKTVWKKIKGNVNLFFDDLLELGSKQVDHKLFDQIRQYNLEEIVTYRPDLLAGIQAQAYDVPLEAAWDKARNRMRLRTKKECKRKISRRYRNFRMNLDFQDESWRYALLPLYIAVYHFGEKRYQVLINGQTGKIAGQRPVDLRKLWNWIGILILPALLIGLLSLVIRAVYGPEWLMNIVNFLFPVVVFYLIFTAVYIFNLLVTSGKLQRGEKL